MTSQLHASCVSVGGAGVLILGSSGSGKSDLALRLIDTSAKLVADDQVILQARDETLFASCPEKIAGMLEVRGVGIVKLPFEREVALRLVVNLVSKQEVERMPEPSFFDCLGLQLPLLSLYPFEGSACAKVRLLLKGDA